MSLEAGSSQELFDPHEAIAGSIQRLTGDALV